MKFKALLYCEKAKPNLWKYEEDYLKYLRSLGVKVSQFELGNKVSKKDTTYKYCEKYTDKIANLNGKIVVECDFEVEEIKKKCVDVFKYCYITDTLNEFELMNKTQLDGNTTNNYLKGKNGYAIHIKNLKIFDKPKELSEYYSIIDMGGGMLGTKPLTNAPKNMMRVSVNHWEYCFYNPSDITILIPVSPLEMYRIANKEQTTLVRKKVLREVIK